MINICICDDEQIMLSKNRVLITNLLNYKGISHKITIYPSAESLLFDLNDSFNFIDIMILDIEMLKMNGMELARKLREKDYVGTIIFLTSHEEYVFESFDVGASHYFLKKNIKSPHFSEAFIKIVNGNLKNADTFYTYENGGHIKRILTGEIIYFEVVNRKITLHIADGEDTFYSTITKIEERVDPNKFVRCHRSFIINISHITEFNKSHVKLSNGVDIPIGKKYSDNLEQFFIKNIQLI